MGLCELFVLFSSMQDHVRKNSRHPFVKIVVAVYIIYINNQQNC